MPHVQHVVNAGGEFEQHQPQQQEQINPEHRVGQASRFLSHAPILSFDDI